MIYLYHNSSLSVSIQSKIESKANALNLRIDKSVTSINYHSLKSGDVILCEKWSCFGDKPIAIVTNIQKCLKVGVKAIYSINSNLCITNDIDPDRLLSLFLLFDEMSFETKSDKISTAIKKRIASGKHQGRVSGSKNKKHVLDGKEVEIFKLVSQGLSYNAIAKKLKVSTPTVIRCIKN